MKKIIFLTLSIVCIVTIFIAGCTSDRNNSNVVPSLSPTVLQPKFNSGDVLAKDDSSVTITVAVASYDDIKDSYVIYDVLKNSAGAWQAHANPSQRTLSRSEVEKIYQKRIGIISNTIQNSAQYTHSTTISSPIIKKPIITLPPTLKPTTLAPLTLVPSPSTTLKILFPKPLTGFLITGSLLTGGEGELTIDNLQGGSDAIAVLTYFGRKDPIISVYIRSGEIYTIKNIADGNYELYILYGENWNASGKKFENNLRYTRFDDAFQYTTTETTTEIKYTTWSVTLYGVIDGNANTEVLSEDSFPELY